MSAFPTSFARSLVVATAAVSVAGCGVNSIPTAEENVKKKWADVQAMFQERANLVDNLLAVTKGATKAEGGILKDVVDARSKATSIQISGADLTDPAKMKAFQDAQGQLSTGLGRLFANVESYPELKSITNWQMLQSQLEGMEHRIRIGITDYNTAVQGYNTEIRTFPSIIGAKVIYGAKPMVPYQAVTRGAEVAPKIEGKI